MFAVGRRIVSKEQETIRDVRYRAAASCDFSETRIFLALTPTASIFSARVHVALKDIQTTDHSLEGTRGWRATTYLET